MTGTRLAHYRILEKLGAGGMGEVYRAHDEQLDREVAIKVLPADSFADAMARARLLREARAAAALNHPAICTIHEVGEAEVESSRLRLRQLLPPFGFTVRSARAAIKLVSGDLRPSLCSGACCHLPLFSAGKGAVERFAAESLWRSEQSTYDAPRDGGYRSELRAR